MAQILRFYKHADANNFLLNFKAPIDLDRINDDTFTFTSKPEKKISIKIDLVINTKIFESIAPETEIGVENSVDYYLSYVSDASRQRGFIEFKENHSKIELTERKHYECELEIDPSMYFGSIDLKGLIVRNKDFKKHKGFLTSKYSILGASKTKKIYIDPFKKFDGSDMEVEFGKVSRSGALYQLQHSNPPKLIINKDTPETIKEMLKYKGTSKTKNIIRDALFRPIAVDAWEQLARKAVEKMTPIEDSSDFGIEVLDPENLEFPYNRIANIIAKSIYGDPKSAVDNLKHDIGIQKKRLELINEKLPMVVQEIAELTEVYSKASKNYWK
jgi:hypothetical protein